MFSNNLTLKGTHSFKQSNFTLMMPTTKKLQVLLTAWTMEYMNSWDNWKSVPTSCLLTLVWITGVSTKTRKLFTFHQNSPYGKNETKYPSLELQP